MFPDLSKRNPNLERLDTGDYTPDEYARWQREMHYINRFSGDTRSLRLELAELLKNGKDSAISVLDVGAGTGELLCSARDMRGVREATLVGADVNAFACGTIAAHLGVLAVQCDALSLPFADSSFDLVVSSLFMHHLEDDAAVELIREMSRVARRRFVVIDLHRHAAAHLLYRAVGRLALQKFTLEDGSLSIRRSRRPNEMMTLAREAGVKEFAVRRRAAFRLVLSGNK